MPWKLPKPSMLNFWMIRRLTFDLLIFLKAWVSSCFPLNSRNSPKTYLLPLSSSLHSNYKNTYCFVKWQQSHHKEQQSIIEGKHESWMELKVMNGALSDIKCITANKQNIPHNQYYQHLPMWQYGLGHLTCKPVLW